MAFTFTTSFTICFKHNELKQDCYGFYFFDGKIVLDSFDTMERESARHKMKIIDPYNNSYRRNNQRDFKRQRDTIAIPQHIKEKALAFIRDQIEIKE